MKGKTLGHLRYLPLPPPSSQGWVVTSPFSSLVRAVTVNTRYSSVTRLGAGGSVLPSNCSSSGISDAILLPPPLLVFCQLRLCILTINVCLSSGRPFYLERFFQGQFYFVLRLTQGLLARGSKFQLQNE